VEQFKDKNYRVNDEVKWERNFGDKSFQSITCTGTDNRIRTTKRQNTQITQNNTTQNGPS